MPARIVPHPAWPVPPCSSCGSRNVVTQPTMVAGDEHHYVVCMECGTRGPLASTGKAAQDAWNQLLRREG